MPWSRRKVAPRLQPSKSNGSTVDSSNNRINIRGGDNIVSTLEADLSKRLRRVVIDKTGIAGRYDVVLSWSPDDGTSLPPSGNCAISAATDLGPSIFTAIEEQLGLRLESQDGPVQVLVIDTIEMPSAN